MTTRTKASIWFPILEHTKLLQLWSSFEPETKMPSNYAYKRLLFTDTQQNLHIVPILPDHKMACLSHFNPQISLYYSHSTRDN